MTNKEEAINLLEQRIAICSASADNENYAVRALTIKEARLILNALESETKSTDYHHPDAEPVLHPPTKKQATPAPGEFTKRIRAFIKNGEKHYDENPDAYLVTLCFQTLKACDRIDRLSAESKGLREQLGAEGYRFREQKQVNKELKAELNQYKLTCPKCTYSKHKELQAELKQAKEVAFRWQTYHQDRREEIIELQAKLKAAELNLKKYGGHHDDCTTPFADYSCRKNCVCECGWSEIDKVLKGVTDGEEPNRSG